MPNGYTDTRDKSGWAKAKNILCPVCLGDGFVCPTTIHHKTKEVLQHKPIKCPNCLGRKVVDDLTERMNELL